VNSEPSPSPDPPGLCAFSVADYLRPLAGDLPGTLVAAPARDAIIDLAARLPGAITSFCGFECPLGSADARADFLLCSTREEGHAGVLAGMHDSIALAPELRTQPAWQRVAAFCRAWLAAGSPLGGELMNTWLEFDIASDADALVEPSMFFGTHPPAPGADPRGQLAALREALAVLDPPALHGHRGRALETLLAALPRGCHVFQVGAMWSRGQAAIRLCLRGVEHVAVPALLDVLDWPGDGDDVAVLLDTFGAHASRVDLDLDLGTRIGPKIGLECYLGTDAATAARLAALSAALVRVDACTPAKAAALDAYQGLTLQDAAPAHWPPHLAALARAGGRGLSSALCRWVHHIKLVHEPGQALTAKAYLAVEHHLLARRELRAHIDAMRSGA